MNYEFFTATSRDADALWASTAELMNCYREPVGDQVVIHGMPGTARFGELDGVFCRAMATIDGKVYAVQGGNVYEIAENGVETLLGQVQDDAATDISGNNGKVTITAGGFYYVWDGTTLSQPASGAFAQFGSVTFASQFTILSELNGRRLQWSNPADPETLGGLDFATAESRDFDILRIMQVGSEILVFTTGSIERWHVGAQGFPRYSNSTIDKGLKSFRLLSKVPDGCFFVASDNAVYGWFGGMQRLSNTAVETAIAKGQPKDCFYFEKEGHKFLAVNFADRPAWVYNLATGEWSRRATGVRLRNWTVTAMTDAYGKFIGGTDLGEMVVLTGECCDGDQPLVRQMTGRTLRFGEQRRHIDEFRLQATTGTTPPNTTDSITDKVLSVDDPASGDVLSTDDPASGNVLLVERGAPFAEEIIQFDWSLDEGHTYGNPLHHGLGRAGEYDREIKFPRLGYFRNFTPRVTYSGQLPLVMSTSAQMRVR